MDDPLLALLAIVLYGQPAFVTLLAFSKRLGAPLLWGLVTALWVPLPWMPGTALATSVANATALYVYALPPLAIVLAFVPLVAVALTPSKKPATTRPRRRGPRHRPRVTT